MLAFGVHLCWLSTQEKASVCRGAGGGGSVRELRRALTTPMVLRAASVARAAAPCAHQLAQSAGDSESAGRLAGSRLADSAAAATAPQAPLERLPPPRPHAAQTTSRTSAASTLLPAQAPAGRPLGAEQSAHGATLRSGTRRSGGSAQQGRARRSGGEDTSWAAQLVALAGRPPSREALAAQRDAIASRSRYAGNQSGSLCLAHSASCPLRDARSSQPCDRTSLHSKLRSCVRTAGQVRCVNV